jgi:hypothetical protein
MKYGLERNAGAWPLLNTTVQLPAGMNDYSSRPSPMKRMEIISERNSKHGLGHISTHERNTNTNIYENNNPFIRAARASLHLLAGWWDECA